MDNQEIVYQLIEAQAEINRHHADFERIREILRRAEIDGVRNPAYNLCKEIRNVVG
jgi:hypothetical protein